MIRLPIRSYLCPEGSEAEQVLDDLGVVFGTNAEGEREVKLDPILMVAVLALQGKVFPMVSQLIELWQKENPEIPEKGEIDAESEEY